LIIRSHPVHAKRIGRSVEVTGFATPHCGQLIVGKEVTMFGAFVGVSFPTPFNFFGDTRAVANHTKTTPLLDESTNKGG
jgi:hypothetical protein